MVLWALRGAILGKGPWLLIRSEKNLNRLRNSPRKRELVSHELALKVIASPAVLL